MISGVFVGLVFAATAAAALQVANAISAVVDAVSVRDSDEPDAVTRTRLRELLWTLAVLAAVAVFIAFGTEGAARLIWDDDQPVGGLGVLVLTATAAFLAGSVGVVAILRRERPTYARLRRDLRDRSTFSVTPDELADFETRLERADEIRRRRPRASLALKILGLVLVIGVGGAAATAHLVTGSLTGLLYVGGVGVHVVAFVVALRGGAVHRARLDAVLEAQRDEVVAMLERARIPQRGSVPGLRDRVARALAILREKQR